MPDSRDFDAVFYVKNVPEISFENGMFHIKHSIGSARFEFVMRPNVFLKALRKSNDLAGEFHGRDEVFVFKGADEH